MAPVAAGGFQALLVALAAEPDPPTTVREPARALELHVADSLSGLAAGPVRCARALVDVGSGAGFPGLALALALPGARVDLLEANRRKCEVIERLIEASRATRARCVARRAEELGAEAGAAAYDVVTARAVAPLAVLCEYAAPLLRPAGALVAWKGGRDDDEEDAGDRAAAALGMGPGQVIAVSPFPAARSRNLHVYVKDRPTPDRFPRRPGMAAKRPLG